ncbi:MAG: endolytic transglycosylase MltG [Cellulosilyticaceae bacterium]
MKDHTGKKRIYFHTIFGVSLLLVGIFGSCIAFTKGYSYALSTVEESTLRKSNPNIRELNLVLTPDSTVKTISSELMDHNFISKPMLFIIEAKLNNLDSQIKPGNYSISSNMSNADIIKRLTQTAKVEETIKFTIPEGFTVTQIAERLEKEGIVKKQDFLKAVNDRTYDYKFLENIPQNSKYHLEGYLFPDTYEVRKDITPEEIIVMMLNRFEYVISQYSAYLHDTNYAMHDIVTIASIIQQEAKVSEERPIISGVIYNRLDANMKLQMCSTIQYALEKRKASLSYADLEIDSPYNTYKFEGLPLGPISSPGEESLSAALQPDNNEYFYFVLKDAESGVHAFSASAAEHANNKVRYKQSIDKNFVE